MRILNITAQKPNSTGSGVYLTEMVKAFRALGHEQVVIAGIAPDDALSFQEDAGGGPCAKKEEAALRFAPVIYERPALPFPVAGMSDEMPYPSTRYCDMTPQMAEQFKAAFQEAARDCIETFDPDLIICHHLYLMTAAVRAITDKPLIALCHGTDIRQMRKHSLERAYIVSGIQAADVLFALHDEQRTEIIEVYDVAESKVRVIGTGYDGKLFHSEGRRQAVPGKLQLLYVGKIWEKKGVKSLIRALDHLPFAPDAFELELLGGHSHAAELEEIQNLAARSRYPIHFRGKRNPEEVAQAYRTSDIFILPSFFEGLPLVAIEALACGCKVILTDLPGIRPWLDKSIPDADICYVTPPPMHNTDEPLPEFLPRFEQELARAIVRTAAQPTHPKNIEDLSWTSLAKNLLAAIY